MRKYILDIGEGKGVRDIGVGGRKEEMRILTFFST